jgi:predicted anti-sigma-YlaC factor YlaD
MSARESVSAGLDGELSELEVVSLDQHLRDCAECRLFANQLRALHSELCAAPLEQAQIQVFVPAFVPAPRSPGRLRSLGRLRAAVAVAAMVAVVGGSSFAVGRIVGAHGGPTETTLTRTTALDLLSLQADSREQHLRAMLQRMEPSDSLRVGSLIAV